MDIRYDQPFTGISGLTAAPAQKAGNISQIASRVRGREAQILSYSYDYLSRLSSSTFHNYSDAGVISGTNNYNENLSYDLRGNIQTMQRTGFYTNGSTCTYGQIDNLTYSYTANTNRLHKVLDGTLTAGDAKSRGFNGLLSTVDNSMTYDRNGNLNKNLHKNVSTITYNHLNLPTVITFTTGNSIEFLYDAAGTKLRKTVKVGATVQYVQDYLPGGIEYRQTGTGVKRVESVFHAEGRYYNTNVDASSTISWRKEYNMKDHLGNTRLVFTDRNANGIVDITGTASTSDVLQENHYYAFGLAFEGAWLQNDATARDNAYQYNGKELNSDFGLGWTDYGARWYDGSIARWNSVDPLAELFVHVSPYAYVKNSPIIMIDPTGAAGVPYTYDWNTGQYKNKKGEEVRWAEVNNYLESNEMKSSASLDSEPNDFQLGTKGFRLEHEPDQLFISESQKKQVQTFIQKNGKGDINIRVSIGSKTTRTKSHEVYQAYVTQLKRIYDEWNRYEGNPEAKKLFTAAIASEMNRAKDLLDSWIPSDTRSYGSMITFQGPQPLMNWAGSVKGYVNNLMGQEFRAKFSFVSQSSSNNSSGMGSGGIGNGAYVLITPRP
jgi:RHS repeat-associated protein